MDIGEKNGFGYEFCPRCEANLTLQKGFSNDLPCWICKGCGEMLINPAVETDSNITWLCDGCGTMLNIQPGFNEECGEWTCAECGFVNKIDASEVYSSEDEYQAELINPFRGLPDEDVLKLAFYQEVECIGGRGDIVLVQHRETGDPYVRKMLTTYDRSVYEYLLTHPIAHMPKIVELYESDNCLIVVEECVAGQTVEELLEQGLFSDKEAIRIAKSVCAILNELHHLPRPIIHRDIKPSNIILSPEKEVFLLDMNVAKWYDPEQTDDTRYLGTPFFAAPEQIGYGFTASSEKSDIYGVGVLLNVMAVGKLPKEERAPGRLWEVIERCISLDARDRYTAAELISKLDEISDDDGEA